MPRLTWYAVLFACFALSPFAERASAFQAASGDSVQSRPPQLIPRTHEDRESRFITEHRIILNVRVSDNAGKPLSDLQESDFELFDNDQPRKLVSFRKVEGGSAVAQAHVILVLDTVNSSWRQLHLSAGEIEKYLRQKDGLLPYPMSIGVFAGSRIRTGLSSRDRDALLAEVKTTSADLHVSGCSLNQDRGETFEAVWPIRTGGVRDDSSKTLECLNGRFVSSVIALRHLAEEQVDVPGRAIVIWIGPGWPLLTDHSFSPDPPAVKQNFFMQLVGVSNALREAQITLSAIASPDSASDLEPPDALFFNGVSDEGQVKAGNLGLHALAYQSGGHIITDKNGLAGQISACIADADTYYVLSFDTPPAATFGEYHSLAVKVDKPALDIRTNTLYYAEQ